MMYIDIFSIYKTEDGMLMYKILYIYFCSFLIIHMFLSIIQNVINQNVISQMFSLFSIAKYKNEINIAFMQS